MTLSGELSADDELPHHHRLLCHGSSSSSCTKDWRPSNLRLVVRTGEV